MFKHSVLFLGCAVLSTQDCLFFSLAETEVFGKPSHLPLPPSMWISRGADWGQPHRHHPKDSNPRLVKRQKRRKAPGSGIHFCAC